MTAQIPDAIQIQRRFYEVCGIHGDEPFTPASLGVVPVSPHTACWRGYVNCYRIYRRRLVLEQLVLYLGDDPEYQPAVPGASLLGPAINGVSPAFEQQSDRLGQNTYKAVHLELPFTGGILAGRGFRQEFYVHMGFAPAWKFDTVYEATFEQGALEELRDVSEQIAVIRERMVKQRLRPDLSEGGHGDLLAWVQSTFRLDYGWGRWL